MQILFIAGFTVITLAIIFALQNAAAVSVRFLMWRFEMSLALLLLLTFALGIVINIIVSLPSRIRKNRLIAEQRKAIKELSNDIMEDGFV